jgi:hypothetical protein
MLPEASTKAQVQETMKRTDYNSICKMKTMKLWRKVLLQALFYFCGFMAIIWLLKIGFSDGIDDWKGEMIKGSLYTVTIIIFNNWKEIKEHIWKQ